MFNYVHAFSGFSVDDLSKAKAFYGEVLGLKVEDNPETGSLKVYLNDHAWVFVYPKSDHQPATFTILNFEVKDIEKAVQDLKDKGVAFEDYPDMSLGEDSIHTDEDSIARNDKGPLIAWFTDPAGNIISVLQS